MKRFFSLLLLSVIVINLSAQETIECDRPDQTETPALVPDGHFQMENGFYWVHESKGERGVVYPASLLKYGIRNIAEFRLEIENSSTILQNERERKAVHGISPLAFGMKLKICDEKRARPQTSVIVMMSVPVLAMAGLREEYPTPEVRFTMQHRLSSRFTFSYNLGGLWDGDKQQLTGLYTITSGCALAEKWSCYLELYGFISKQQDHRFDGGLAYYPRKNVMLDVSAGLSIDRTSPAWFGGLGVSFRLPD